MQPLNSPDFDAIKKQIRISEILSRYVSVPNRIRFRIPCPIHHGDGYNFGVDDERGLFHCFTCEAAGDVVTLFGLLEGITNGEAARRLAFEYDVRPGEHKSFNRIFNEVRRYEPKQGPMPTIDLPESQPLEAYRRFSKEAIAHFGLRLVPEGVLIPFREEGRAIGYSIRQINKTPKYKNMLEFRKSEYLYGLWENQQYMASKVVYVVEGQFDCIRMWDSGFRNVVSTLNATMSMQQANILTYWVSKIIVVYDGDEKGRAGAQQIKEKYGALFTIQIIDLPDGCDPDTADLKRILNNNGETDDKLGTVRTGEDLV